MVFPKFFDGVDDFNVFSQVSLMRRWKVSPFYAMFRGKLAMMLNGRLLHGTIHRDEHVTNRNHATVRGGREHDDHPSQTGHYDRHRADCTRVHSRLLPPILLNYLHPSIWREMRSDGRQSEVVLECDFGWVVG